MSPLARAAVVGSAVLTLTVALSACVPEPAASPEASPRASQTAETPTAVPTATPTLTPTPDPTPAVALPASCEQAFSEGQRATLEGQGLPLNDPGVTLLSTDQAPLLELLATVPTIRCSWGTPSERGIATNVSIVDASQAATVRDTLASAGYGCEGTGSATLCRIEQRGVSLDDVPFERGEVQALSGDVWVSTAWINVDLGSYTEDILSTVVG